ncbi:GAF domain-containing sensor histidine kinase [Flavobacterium hauense]
MAVSEENFEQDIHDIGQISIIPTMLNVICQTTGMGFSAVARVTDDRWITCSVRDDINFGMVPGSELEIKTTICNEIRESQKAVIIDHVSESPEFRNHHTPAMYGFQSYISIPIIRKDGTFFGTLCAIDPSPNILNTPAVTGMFNLFADLISFHLNSIEEARSTKKKLEKEKAFKDILEKEVEQRTLDIKESNKSLEKMNKELQAFAYISSHDLQEPLRKIQTIATIIAETEVDKLSDKGKDYFERMKNAAERMQALINDLLAYSRTNIAEGNIEETDLQLILDEIIIDVSDDLKEKNGRIEATEMCHAKIIPFQFRQLLYNIITNSIKFSNPDKALVITINSHIVKGSFFNDDRLKPESDYCHIHIEDNGIGFEPKYNERIFELFQRLNDKSQFKGTGIGLAIVKRIVENHKGFISAQGELGRGAAFDVFIPA